MNTTKHMTTNTTKTPAVEFECCAPAAQRVFVAGTFNEWKPDATPLVRDKEGNWRCSLSLLPGRYEFKFIVDGHWCCEPGRDDEHDDCPNCCVNEFGTMNRVLKVN